MQTIKHCQIIITLIVCLISVGCTTSSADLHDENSITLRELKESRSLVRGVSGLQGKISLWSDNQLQGFSRSQANELDNVFPQFPNPTIYIYIDPHITSDGLPIPGVTTKTKLMKRSEYALPHELHSLEQ